MGETLSCSRETSNLHDLFAVKVLKTDEIVGHLPKRSVLLVAFFFFEKRRNNNVQSQWRKEIL